VLSSRTQRRLRRLPRGPRLALVGALAVAAPVVGGPPGGLLAIVAGLVALDAAVPMPGVTWSEAEDRFARVQRARRRARMRRRAEGLEVLDDRAGWAASAARRQLGVQPIAVDSITGTVELAKARTFDRAFRPDRGSAEHWKRLWMAQARGAPMPPISVYRVGEEHVVRDGHHRVSVARDLGLGAIDADVVELAGPRISSRSPAGPSSRARGTRPPAPRSAPSIATAAPSRAPAPPRRRR
jgi:hypothetical protein